MKKIIILDLDGLLVNTEPIFFRAIKTVLKDEGIIVEEKSYIEEDIQKGRHILDVVKKDNHIQDLASVQRRVYQTYSKLLEQNRSHLFMPGALQVIRRLKKYFLLAIASSSRREYVERFLGDAGVLNDFATTVCREDVKRLKPFPDCFLEVARRLHVNPNVCIVIEDSQRGLSAAKKAGMRCIIVPNNLTAGYDYRGAVLVLDTLYQINKRTIEDIFNKKTHRILQT